MASINYYFSSRTLFITEDGFKLYNALHENDTSTFEKLLNDGAMMTSTVFTDVISKKKTEFYPHILNSEQVNKFEINSGQPFFFLLEFLNSDLETWKLVLKKADLRMTSKTGETILHRAVFAKVPILKYVLNKMQESKIRISGNIMEFCIENNMIDSFNILKKYTPIESYHIQHALLCKCSPLWFDVLNTYKPVYPHYLVDAYYDFSIFEKLCNKVLFYSNSNLNELIFLYDTDLLHNEEIIRFLFSKKIPKPPLRYLNKVSYSLEEYYTDETEFIKGLFVERGLGMIILEYVYEKK